MNERCFLLKIHFLFLGTFFVYYEIPKILYFVLVASPLFLNSKIEKTNYAWFCNPLWGQVALEQITGMKEGFYEPKPELFATMGAVTMIIILTSG